MKTHSFICSETCFQQNIIENLFIIFLQNSDRFAAITRNFWRCIWFCFRLIFNEFKLKNTLIINKQYAWLPKISQIHSVLLGIRSKVPWIFWTTFFSLKTAISFIQVEYQNGVELRGWFPFTKIYFFNLNLKFTVMNVLFIFNSFIWDID